MTTPRIVYPRASQSQTRNPNFKLSNVKVKSNPHKLKNRENEILQLQGQTSSSVTDLKDVNLELELLSELEEMISQLQYNIFHQKCASDKNLSLNPRDLDRMLKTDFWKDCCNYTIHIAVSFARYLQRIRDIRPKVSFQLADRSRNTDEGGSMALTYKEIDIDQVGSCLQELHRIIKKHYADETTSSSSQSRVVSFHQRKSARILSTSLPRNLPSSLVTSAESIQLYSGSQPRPKTATPNDLKDLLTSILSILSRDKNSFPQSTRADDLEMKDVQIDPRSPENQSTHQNSITSFINNYYNSRPAALSNSDLEWSSISATDVDTESDYAATTPITSASVSATSIRSQKENEGSNQHEPVAYAASISTGQSSNQPEKYTSIRGKPIKLKPNSTGIRDKKISVVPRSGLTRLRYGNNSV